MTEEHLYTVKLERNMVLPTYVNIKLFKQLKLPIYMDPTGHKCHFKDVSIALTKKALKKIAKKLDYKCGKRTIDPLKAPALHACVQECMKYESPVPLALYELCAL